MALKSVLWLCVREAEAFPLDSGGNLLDASTHSRFLR
jgi:hypothetical protein